VNVHAARTAVEPRPSTGSGLSDADFGRISALIGTRTGIKLTPSKRMNIETGLRRRASTLGFDSVDAYCRMVFDGGGLSRELDAIIHLATTNKTDFFREKAHYDLLDRSLVPQLLETGSRVGSRRLKVWSAAASNGAEAYTAAIVLAEAAARGPRFGFSVLGTDISAEMVAAASRAVYPGNMIDPVPPELKRRYFMQSRERSASTPVRVVPELRRFVRFYTLNLIDKSYPVDRDIDVIFLRNVLIYFDAPTQQAVVRRLAGHVRPGGFLILGHTEAAIGNTVGLSQVATGVFRVE